VSKIILKYRNINIEEKKLTRVSDREILKVMKEQNNLPVKFSRPIKLTLLLNYYYKYWNNEFTDESDSDE
jgi:hypothetical protein